MVKSDSREVNREDYDRLQTALLKEKGGDAQREFLKAVKDNGEFLDFMNEKIRMTDGDSLPLFDGPLTEASFKEPTTDQERRMYEVWRDVTPRTACRVSFWAGITLGHIRAGKIAEVSWLASNRRCIWAETVTPVQSTIA